MLNKIAFVTGETRGIGRAVSEELAKKYKYVIAGYASNETTVKVWVKILNEKNITNIGLFKADISSPKTSQEIENQILDKYGTIDILVNNAGITRNTLFNKMNYESWDKVLQTNLYSLFVITKPIMDSMIKNKFGRIINISSVNGQKGQYNEVNYSTAKAGIIKHALKL